MDKGLKLATGIVIAVFALLLVLGSIVIIPAGNVGVITQFGATTERIVSQGFSLKLPMVQNVHIMSIQTQLYQASNLTAASKDLQDVKTTIAINFRMAPEKASEVFRTIGTDYMEVIAHPAIQETVKEITARYNAEDCIVKRDEVKGALSIDRYIERNHQRKGNVLLFPLPPAWANSLSLLSTYRVTS